jgi:hypothetical protein
MGYSMRQRHAQIRIPVTQLAAAFAALLPLCAEYPVRAADGYLPLPTTLDDLLVHYGWKPTHDAAGNIVDLCFHGDKYGSFEDDFLPLLAPFVEPGSSLTMEGEDGAIWRWLFRDQTVITQPGRIVCDDPPTTLPSADA